ncbi:MAG TPA: thymidine kinase, partial [Propionicimonas sp.]|nr:thymidine kinase [Propionicimonas sp.]
MAELTYFTGPMDCGKSTLALQVAYTESTAGRQGRLFTMLDRSGEATITSRIGLTSPASEVTLDLVRWKYVGSELT